MILARENDIDLLTTKNITNFLKKEFKDVIERALKIEFNGICDMKKINIANLKILETEV